MTSRTTTLPTLGLLAMTAVWVSTFFMIEDVVARMPDAPARTTAKMAVFGIR